MGAKVRTADDVVLLNPVAPGISQACFRGSARSAGSPCGGDDFICPSFCVVLCFLFGLFPGKGKGVWYYRLISKFWSEYFAKETCTMCYGKCGLRESGCRGRKLCFSCVVFLFVSGVGSVCH